jgi:hypothetical protein
VSGKAVAVIAGMAVGMTSAMSAGSAGAQTAQETARAVARRQNQQRNAAEQMRYQIGTMERVLENAVEHGASVWRDRLQALAPVQALLVENARVRGYRLEGYGLFFDIDVPSLDFTLFTAMQTLDQNGLGLQSALNQLRTYIQAQAANDPNLQQALKRIELQLPAAVTTTADVSNARSATGSAAFTSNDRPAVDANDPILTSPAEVFRAEVMQSIVDALLDHSAPLGLGPDEWLTVGVRRNEMRPRIGLDTNAQTVIARLRGSDLAAFRAGQVSREDAFKRVEVRVF